MQEAVPLIITLEELGHKQEPVPLNTANSTYILTSNLFHNIAK